MKRADDDVKCDPGNDEPARPVAAVKHKHAGDDLQESREMNVPVTFKVRGNQAAD